MSMYTSIILEYAYMYLHVKAL